MTKPEFVELVLTCKSWQEAQRIADSLLMKGLIACATFLPVERAGGNQGAVEPVKEVILFMESIKIHFENAAAEVEQQLGYGAETLKVIPVEHISSKALEWLDKSVRSTSSPEEVTAIHGQ